MSSHDSTRVIIIALLANLGIAIAKSIGAFISGSASLLAEAVHSFVDCSNQVLLLVGSKKAKKKADAHHPLGYAREAFFWSFIVAILLFSMGGLFAIYEGIHKLGEKNNFEAPYLGLAILLFAIILESYSFVACLKEVKLQNRFGSLWHWFRKTSSSELLVIFTEDAAALLGLVIATVSILLAWLLNDSRYDAWGSIVVGAVLVVVAVLLAIEIKSFIIGEAANKDIETFVKQRVTELFTGGKVLKFIGLQTGPHEAMIAYKVHPGQLNDLSRAISLVNQLELQVKTAFPEVGWQFVELDDQD